LYATAGGRMLLAGRDEAQTARYLQRLSPTRLTGATEVNKRRLAEAIAAARQDGFAQTIDQAAEGVTGTAAIIRGVAGEPVGALVVAAPSSRLQDRLDALAALVREEAKAISRTLGYRSPTA